MKVVIVDDNQNFRVFIRRLLGKTNNLEIVGEATNGLEAIQLLDFVPTDIVLLDIEMPGMTGIEVLRKLTELGKDLLIIIVSSFLDAYMVEETIALGAAGYILKDDLGKDLVDAIQVVWPGTVERAYLSRSVRSIIHNPNDLFSIGYS
jgi:DNA-binding NarL/FixJ family response regulator